MNAEFSQLFELSVAEKLQLVEDLWDSIGAESGQIPVFDWQKEELTHRKAAYLQNPSAATSWETVKQRIRDRRSDA